jgi:hypothetical protein
MMETPLWFLIKTVFWIITFPLSWCIRIQNKDLTTENIKTLQLGDRSIPRPYGPTRLLWNNIPNPGNAKLCAALVVRPWK